MLALNMALNRWNEPEFGNNPCQQRQLQDAVRPNCKHVKLLPALASRAKQIANPRGLVVQRSTFQDGLDFASYLHSLNAGRMSKTAQEIGKTTPVSKFDLKGEHKVSPCLGKVLQNYSLLFLRQPCYPEHGCCSR